MSCRYVSLVFLCGAFVACKPRESQLREVQSSTLPERYQLQGRVLISDLAKKQIKADLAKQRVQGGLNPNQCMQYVKAKAGDIDFLTEEVVIGPLGEEKQIVDDSREKPTHTVKRALVLVAPYSCPKDPDSEKEFVLAATLEVIKLYLFDPVVEGGSQIYQLSTDSRFPKLVGKLTVNENLEIPNRYEILSLCSGEFSKTCILRIRPDTRMIEKISFPAPKGI